MRQFLQTIIYRIRGTVTTKALISNGMKVGSNFSRMNDVWIDPGHCWLIHIGNNVTLAPRVMILAHDASLQKIMHTTQVGTVKISDNVFVGAGSIILPGVHIGTDSIIGAGSIVSSDIPANTVAVGNPAAVLMSVDEFKKKHLRKMQTLPCFDKSYTMPRISSKQKEEMNKKLLFSKGYLI